MRTLGSAYRSGMLSTGTFELRVGAALQARTAEELRRLVADVNGLQRLRLWLVERLAGPTVRAADIVELPLPAARLRATVGRDPRCDVVLTDPTVSRFHLAVRRQAGRWVIRDLDSRNGTWFHGRRTAGMEVRAGDEVRLGDVTVRIVDAG